MKLFIAVMDVIYVVLFNSCVDVCSVSNKSLKWMLLQMLGSKLPTQSHHQATILRRGPQSLSIHAAF